MTPETKTAVLEELSDLMYVPFQFENSGTRVIHFTPETYVAKEGIIL